MHSVRPIRVCPRASWMCPCSDSAGCVFSIASRTAVDPTGSGAWPPCLGVMSGLTLGVSSRPEPYGGQWKLKITRSGGFVSVEVIARSRASRASLSSSR